MGDAAEMLEDSIYNGVTEKYWNANLKINERKFMNELEVKNNNMVVSSDGEVLKELPKEVMPTLIDNMSSLPIGMVELTPEQQDILYAPVDEKLVCIRPDGLIYLPWMEYVTRLRKAFGMKWAVIPKGEPKHLGNLISWGFYLVVNGNYCGYAIGEQEWRENNYTMSLTDAFEGAKSNALMRLCKGIGISLELWQPDFINNWKDKYSESCWAEKDGKKKQLWYKKGFKHLPYGWKDCSFTPASTKTTIKKEMHIDELGGQPGDEILKKSKKVFGGEEHFEDATSDKPDINPKNPTLLKEFAEFKKAIGSDIEYYRYLYICSEGKKHSNEVEPHLREYVLKGMYDMAEGKITNPDSNKVPKGRLFCDGTLPDGKKCNAEIKHPNSIKYYAEHPDKTVLCVKCGKK